MPPEEWHEVNLPNIIETVRTTLVYFGEAFNEKFYPIFERYGSQVSSNDEQLFAHVIPRFVKMCEQPSYFTFMLACTYTSELVMYFATRKMCFRFMGTAYKCLLAAFNRGFCKSFEALGGMEGLRLFCEGHNDVVLSAHPTETLRDIIIEDCPHSKREVSAIISECKRVDDISLTEDELSLIRSGEYCAVEAAMLPVFTHFNPSASSDSFQFEWNFRSSGPTIFLTTLVDFGTDSVYSTTLRHVAVAEQTDREIEESKKHSILTKILRKNFRNIDFYNLIGTVFCPRKLDYRPRRSSSDMECDEEEMLLLNDTIVDLSKAYAISKEPIEFFSRLTARTCRWCDQKCYLLGSHFFQTHRDLCMSPALSEEEES